jgi:hypothetical protein
VSTASIRLNSVMAISFSDFLQHCATLSAGQGKLVHHGVQAKTSFFLLYGRLMQFEVPKLQIAQIARVR